MCWPLDKQLDTVRHSLEGRGMRFFPGRTQRQQESLMFGPAPKVVWVRGSSEGCWAAKVLLIVHTPLGHLYSVPRLCCKTTSGGRRSSPKLTQANKWDFSKFLNMVMVVVTVICVWRGVQSPLPLLGILERWTRRGSNCPPHENNLNKARLCCSQAHSAIYSTVHPRRLNQLTAFSPPGIKIWK